MQKLYRRVLAAGAIAVGLTACGDKVTTVSPTPPGVHSVTVAPASVNATIGQTVKFAASVDADSGFATTVTWTSGNSAIATVDGSGNVTAVSAGTTTITATSTANTGKTGVGSITVAAPPPGLISFAVTPTQVNMDPGATVQAAANIITQPGVTAPAVSWSSGNSAIASVSGTGLITAVSAGTAVISASITLGGQTLSASIAVTVNNIIPASVSIKGVTQGATTVPVNLTNVNGQIEINMNFNPGGQIVDSMNVYIMPGTSAPTSTTKPAAQQKYATNPSAGEVDLSVPTQRFTKNPAAGTTTVDFPNGQVTVYAVIYPHGKTAVNADNTVQMVLTNADGWAADIGGDTFANVNPAAGTLPHSANSAAGVTFWGGPGAPGILTVELYPVVYTPGRSVSSVTWTMGPGGVPGCGLATQTSLPFIQTFGYAGASATNDCTNYENVGGAPAVRDNVVVTAALDNQSNTYALVNAGTPLIPNIIWLGGTPDSLRLDWKAPSVNTPSIERARPAVRGWVNASYNFLQSFSATDLGVGAAASTGAVSYTSANCPGVVAVNVAMPHGTGADINGGVACPTNAIGGRPGILAEDAPWTVSGTEADLLGNVGTSGSTDTFGTDYTAPSIRWGLADAVDAGLVLPAAYGGTIADPVDSTEHTATVVKVAGVYGQFRAEYLDDRAGFYNMGQPSGGRAAQSEMLSYAGHLQPLGMCIIDGTTIPGANFVTNPGCGFLPITNGISGVRFDGWQPGDSVEIPLQEGYYGYKTFVEDEAGNISSTLFRSVLVNQESPFATGLGVPAQLDGMNFNFLATYSDSAELVAYSLQLEYPNFPTVDSVRYNRASIGTAFDNVITSPFAGNNAPPTGAPYARRIEIVNANAFPTSNVEPTGTPVNVKPTTARAWSWNFGSTFGFGVAFPAPGVSPLISIPGLNVQNGQDVATWNTNNPTESVTNWRVIATTATSNQFGSTTPLRAQAASPTNTPNAPFSRVDFYRLDASNGWWNYLGSVSNSAAIPSDQGTYRSWVYALPNNQFKNAWNTTAIQGAIASGNFVVAVGVLPNGDAIATLQTTMTP